MPVSFSTKNKAALITLVVVLITIVLGYNFIYKVNVNKMQGLIKASEDNKQTNSLLHEIDGIRVKIDAYIDKSSVSSDVSQFLSNIADAAASCGIKIDSIVPGKSTAEGDFIFLACKINFTCPYRKMRFFMAKLEGDKKFIRIEKLSMKPVKVAKNSAEVAEGDPWERQSALGAKEMLKKNKTDGIWLNVDMEIVGFWFNTGAING